MIKLHKLKRSAFTSKWLGVIGLLNKSIDAAIGYLTQSLNFDSSDPQVLYNLAGAYSIKGEYLIALDLIKKCLEIDRNYPQAKELEKQILNVINNK